MKDEELAAAGWLYIEKQQLWLERALQGEFSRVEQTVNQTELFEGMNQQRQWLYSLKEIQLQIEIIISLLKDNADKEAQHFRKWAAEVISTLTAANLN